MMWRPMRRFKQELTKEDCAAVLREEKRGVLAVLGDEGYPYAVPLNFYYDEENERLYFHCAKEGHKIDAIKRCEKVCFTVMNQGWREEGDWAYHPSSVIAFGRARLVKNDIEKFAAARSLGRKYFPTEEDVEAEVAHSGNRVQMVAIEIEHMTGKQVYEK